MAARHTVQALIIGSGAGGAMTAQVLTSAGIDTLIIEEGRRGDLSDYGNNCPDGMQKMYRRRGMTPIMGSVAIGYAEGRCYGGGTEINSGFWHRTPPEILLRWKAQYDLVDAYPKDLEEHFIWIEDQLHVSLYGREWPASTRVFARGIEAMGWSYQEVPRVVADCEGLNYCPNGCPSGAKRSMSRTLLPQAEQARAKVITNCRVKLLIKHKKRVTGVLATLLHENGAEELIRIDADQVFVCAGATETPALLRRSGIRFHIGDSFRIHPMLKVVAKFREEINAYKTVLPLLQVKEFWPEISLGGAFCAPGHLAMVLSENWLTNKLQMNCFRNMAIFYVAVRGIGKGTIRSTRTGEDATSIRYELSREDLRNLSRGLAYLSTLLLAAGAVEVYPSAYGLGPINNEIEAIRWLDELLPKSSLSLTTIHAFSSCPMGERIDRCAADSFGKVYHYENLYINDGSMIPDSPGVNPQGTIMGFARRNALHFVEELR
jgi:choline dehydrogenase-like flavoprotein